MESESKDSCLQKGAVLISEMTLGHSSNRFKAARTEAVGRLYTASDIQFFFRKEVEVDG